MRKSWLTNSVAAVVSEWCTKPHKVSQQQYCQQRYNNCASILKQHLVGVASGLEVFVVCSLNQNHGAVSTMARHTTHKHSNHTQNTTRRATSTNTTNSYNDNQAQTDAHNHMHNTHTHHRPVGTLALELERQATNNVQTTRCRRQRVHLAPRSSLNDTRRGTCANDRELPKPSNITQLGQTSEQPPIQPTKPTVRSVSKPSLTPNIGGKSRRHSSNMSRNTQLPVERGYCSHSTDTS